MQKYVAIEGGGDYFGDIQLVNIWVTTYLRKKRRNGDEKSSNRRGRSK